MLCLQESLSPTRASWSVLLNSKHRAVIVGCPLTKLHMVFGHSHLGHAPHYSSLRYLETDDDLVSICEKGRLDNALDILRCLDQQGVAPSAEVYTLLLRLCSRRKALGPAKQVRAYIVKHGLEQNKRLSEEVVSSLVNCGGLEEAAQVFSRMPHRSVFSWTSIISGYSKAGKVGEALRLYQLMQGEGFRPSKYTIVSLLKACGITADLQEGKRIHTDAKTYRCENDLFVATSLIDMYAKCRSIVNARAVFDRLSTRDVVSWNAMLAAYAQTGEPEIVLELYEQMLKDGVTPDSWTYVSLLQSSALLAEKESFFGVHSQMIKLYSIAKGKAVHVAAFVKGYHYDVFVGNTLISMYARCGSVVDAQIVFDGLHERDVVSWTAMLDTYAQQGKADKALKLYRHMREEGVIPDVRMFVVMLQACVTCAEREVGISMDGVSIKIRSLWIGKALHSEVKRSKFDSDGIVGCTLLSTYGKCGSMKDAENVLSGLSEHDVVPWNAMLVAYLETGQPAKTLCVYEQMLHNGITPNDRSFVSVLQACGALAEEEEDVVVDGEFLKVMSLERGKAVHGEAHKQGFDLDMFVGNTLVSMFGKCGSLTDAQGVFERLSKQDVVSWNVMLEAYAQRGEEEKALQLYDRMLEEGVNPDETTVVCLLQTCSKTGSLGLCRQIHDIAFARNGLSLPLANTLIHAYGRCSSMADAEIVFDALPQPDVVSWTALIAGYAREGNFAATLHCYRRMLQEGVKPDGVTFLSLLAACSHAGLVDKGFEYFKSMSKDYGITPRIEHYASMVDLLGRAGNFRSIKKLLRTMPVEPDLEMWSSLLSACRKHGNVPLGKQAFDCAVRLQPGYAAAYVMMANIYLDAGMRDEAKVVNEMRQKGGARKKVEPGQSWLEHDDNVLTFEIGGCKLSRRRHDLSSK